MNENLIYYVIGINLIAYAVYAIDKLLAIKGGRRVSEINLLLLVFAGGLIGSLSGMIIHRHKTKKASFLFKYVSVVLFFIVIVATCMIGKETIYVVREKDFQRLSK